MGKLYSLLSALLTAAAVATLTAADPARVYEWWFDTDYAASQSGEFDGDVTEFTVDPAGLSRGPHWFNCRVAVDTCGYGSVYRKLFFAPGESTGETIYEYWWDNDRSTLVSGDITSGSAALDIDLSALTPGVHYFNCRLSDADGEWGAPYRSMFFTVENGTAASAYEYWWDSAHSAPVSGAITAQSTTFEIDASDLTPGVHWLNCRLRTNLGTWGAPYRKMVFTTPTGLDATHYEYWLDDRYASRTVGEIADTLNVYTVDLDGIRKGLHRFNYRMRDGAGEWGAVYTRHFYYATAGTPFTRYEYWLDNDYESRRTATTDSNPVTFEIDLDGFDKRGAHYFNLRVRDDDGDWSSFYRKLIVFYPDSARVPLTGYRHYINGRNLGYVEVPRTLADSYTFTVDLPDTLQFGIAGRRPVIEDDRVTVEGCDTARYLMQICTEAGWAPPEMWDIEIAGSFTAPVTDMEINSLHLFATPGRGEFAAVRFTAGTDPVYFRADAPVALDLWHGDELAATITGSQLAEMTSLQLDPGLYYGLLHDAAPGAAESFTFHIMDRANRVPEPEVTFADGMVTMTCPRSDAAIYYTLDRPAPDMPDTTSIRYTEPFALSRNALIRAIAAVPGSDIEPSGVFELAVDHYKVADPEIRFTDLRVEILADQGEGVVTRYTLDGNEPTGESPVYSTPIELRADATVSARSWRDGYRPSETVTWAYVHADYVTLPPRITVDGTAVTLTALTPGSTLWYSIGDPDPEAMEPYEDTFMMEGNGTIYAQARKTGMYDSEIAEYEINGRRMPRPQIIRSGRTVTISCPREDAVIRYTLDGSVPAQGSESTVIYTPGEVIDHDRNGTVRAIASDPELNLDDSEMAELVIDDFRVAKPVIRFNNLMIEIVADQSDGVRTYYTLDHSEPDETSELYGSPFSLSGNVTVRARSYKEGYHASEVADFSYNHATYVTAPPQVSVSGNRVTLTAVTDGSTLWYAIGNPDPAAMTQYEVPITMTTNGTVYAQARKQGMFDSEVVSATVSDNQVSAPEIRFADLKIEILSEQSEGVITRYTLDGNPPTETSALYAAPFDAPASDATIRARSWRDGFNPSEITTYSFVRADHTVAAPQISVSGNSVTLTAVTDGSTLWYAIGNPDPAAMTGYTGPVTVEGNLTLYAQARKTGMYDSEVVSYAMNGQRTATPYGEFDRATMRLTLRCATPGAAISYAIGTPDSEWLTYGGPVAIEGNCTVYARAKAPDYLESDVAEIVISQFSCAGVTVGYDGRYITLATAEPAAELRYTFGDGNPAEGDTYNGPVDAGGLVTIRAVAVKPGYMDSEISTYTVEGYADETHAETSRPGILAACYGWAPEGTVDSMERLTVTGELDADDYAYIRSMGSLHHLDLTGVRSAEMPDGALAATGLISVEMPESLTGYGDRVLGDNPGLCAVVWHSRTLRADPRLTAGADNPNLLIYLPYDDQAGDCGVANRIANGQAAAIVLTDSYPFHAPLGFTASEISYTRHFSKPTIIGVCAGWETLALPFRVGTIHDAAGEIHPFATAADGDRPFWLYRPTASGWEMTGVIEPYEPYLISMPNNPEYVDSYNIRGDVSFKATNASVEPTPEPEGKACFAGSLLWAEFGGRQADDRLRTVNDEQLDGCEAGSVFVGGMRDVRPFECFLTSDDVRRLLPIFDSSKLDELMSWQGVKIWAEGRDLCIMSAVACRLPVYDLRGVPVRVADVQPGRVCRVTGLDTGFYIVARKKVLLAD